MKILIWKLKYTYYIHRMLRLPFCVCWDMAESTVELFIDDICDGGLSPKEAALMEVEEWRACS